jgi:spore germination protein PE
MRTSSVDSIQINSVSLSSIVEVGDTSIIQSFSRALAIQREQELFFGNEGNFSAYSIFSEKLPFNPITEPLSLQIDNQASPVIKVKNINLIGVSSSSIVQIGSSRMIQMETRIKHIRHLMDDKDSNHSKSGNRPI